MINKVCILDSHSVQHQTWVYLNTASGLARTMVKVIKEHVNGQ